MPMSRSRVATSRATRADGIGSPLTWSRANRAAHAVTGLELPEGTFSLASFEHLFGGYDAGYYGYLWSKVYGDDMFGRFRSAGVTNPEIGAAYRREILESGGARDGSVMLKAFLGREPSNATFLELMGIGPRAADDAGAQGADAAPSEAAEAEVGAPGGGEGRPGGQAIG